MANDSVIAVDLGAGAVKVGEFMRTRTGLSLNRFFLSDLNLDPAAKEEEVRDKTTQALISIFKENNIRNKSIYYAISAQSVFTKFIKLPPIDKPEKIKQIIRYEAQQNVPFPIDQVAWDYQMIGQEGGFELEVALLAVKSEIIESHYAMLRQCGLNPLVTDVSALALYNAYQYNYEHTAGCTLLIDVGATTTNLVFVEPTRFFCRNIQLGGNNLTQMIASEFQISFPEAERLKKTKGFVGLGGAYEDPKDPEVARLSKILRQGMTKLHAEIFRSVNFFKSQQGGHSPDQILLCGGTASCPYAPQFFKEKLNVPVDFFNPLQKVAVADKIQPDLEKSSYLLGELVGLALRQVVTCPVEINLEPSSVLADREEKRKFPVYLFAAAAVVTAIFVYWLLLFMQWNMKSADLATAQETLATLQANKSSLEAESKKLESAKALLDQTLTTLNQKNHWVNVLNELNQNIHANMWITQFRPTGERLAPTTPPVTTGPGRAAPRPGRPGSTPPAPAAEAPAVYLIEGLCVAERKKDGENRENLVYEFVQALAKSRYFEIPDVNKAIVDLKAPKSSDLVYSFQIRVAIRPPSVMEILKPEKSSPDAPAKSAP
ncbi:MAG: type IV pilus assembly protein PilM [Verrucomicrobiae bacterium]|nr:type IV pilus assembly protein PilM [Verrucomicrobiae bacterium]